MKYANDMPNKEKCFSSNMLKWELLIDLDKKHKNVQVCFGHKRRMHDKSRTSLVLFIISLPCFGRRKRFQFRRCGAPEHFQDNHRVPLGFSDKEWNMQPAWNVPIFMISCLCFFLRLSPLWCQLFSFKIFLVLDVWIIFWCWVTEDD